MLLNRDQATVNSYKKRMKILDSENSALRVQLDLAKAQILELKSKISDLELLQSVMKVQETETEIEVEESEIKPKRKKKEIKTEIEVKESVEIKEV